MKEDENSLIDKVLCVWSLCWDQGIICVHNNDPHISKLLGQALDNNKYADL